MSRLTARNSLRDNSLARFAIFSMAAYSALFVNLRVSCAGTGSLAGFEFKGPSPGHSREWLEPLTSWLEEHAQATGQIIQIQIIQEKRSGKDTALNALVALPILNSERKNTCVILHELESSNSQTLKTGKTELECGLGLNGVLESTKIHQAMRSLSDTQLKPREWEARFAWLTLELLDLLESPVSARPPEIKTGTHAQHLDRFISRWKGFQSASKTHDLNATFDPDAVLDEEGLYPDGGRGSLSGRTVRRLPDAAVAILIGGFLLGLSLAANIARKPAYRCTSAGLFRLKLSDRLEDRVRDIIRRISKKKTLNSRKEAHVLKG